MFESVCTQLYIITNVYSKTLQYKKQNNEKDK